MTKKQLLEILEQYPEDKEIRLELVYDDGYAIAAGELETIKECTRTNTVVLCGYDG